MIVEKPFRSTLLTLLCFVVAGNSHCIAQEPKLRVRLSHPSEWGVKTLAFSPDGKRLLSSSSPSVKVWDLSAGKELGNITGEWAVFDPDGKIWVHAKESMELWNAGGSASIRSIPTAMSLVPKIAISPDGGTIASIAPRPGSPPAPVTLFELASGKPRAHITIPSVISFAFSPDGGLLATGTHSQECDVMLWDTLKGENVAKFSTAKNRYVRALAFSPDGKTLAESGDTASQICLWEVPAGKLLKSLPVRTATCLAFSPDGKMLAAGKKGKVKSLELWDLQRYEHLATIECGWLWSVAFSADGRYLASGSRGGQIEIWDLRPGK